MSIAPFFFAKSIDLSNKQSIASFQKEIEDELKSEPSHVLCGRVSRDPKDELHVQALRDKFAVIPASVSWSGLKRLLKLYYSNATDPNDENIKPGRKTPRTVVEE